MTKIYDAVVVGSGPNGLAAAITLARAGRSVLVLEAQKEFGGGARSGELTLPGFTHDLFSAVHPMALESQFFRELPLEAHGLSWIHSPAEVAHPMDDGTAVLLLRSVEKTAEGMGLDQERYCSFVNGLLKDWTYIKEEFLRPIRIPRDPLRLAKFGLPALLPARLLSRLLFKEERAAALLGGIAAHSTLSLDSFGTSAFALMLLLAGHHVGWPFPRGGAGAIARALVSYLRSLGGEVICDHPVTTMQDLPRAKASLFDVGPGQLAGIAGPELGPSFSSRLRKFRRAPGTFKLDWALRGPIPWRAPETALAATVHLGGTMRELAASERLPVRRKTSERPFVLLVQPSLFDPSRSPAGQHTAWAYCHVPTGSQVDMTARIEAQVERFAPGFRDLILARHILTPSGLEARNANLVGGDISGGAVDLPQLFLRPTARLYRTSKHEIYICSSSTPPGSGVHGLCGFYAAREALAGCLK